MSNIFSDIVGVVDGSALKNWFSSLGGEIGSGIEAGFAAVISDVWNVIVGPVEVIAGVIIIIVALVFAFKDDIMQAGLAFGLLAK